MSVLEGLRLALDQIWSHKLKSFFSLLGIAVGITFLIAVITIVEGMNRYVQEDVGGSIFGVNTFTIVQRTRVQTGTRTVEEHRREARNPPLDLRDVEVVRRSAPASSLVAWADDRFFDEIRHGQRSRKNVRLVGGSEAYMQLQGWEVASGRGLSALDHRRALRVTVLGADIAEKLFPDGSPLGETVRAGPNRYEVVGVLDRQGGLFGNIRDASFVVPYSTYRRTAASNPDRVEAIHVKTETTDAMDAAMASVEGALRSDRGLRPGQDNTFHVETSSDLLSAWSQINRILLTALPGLVSIALVVGGIVIMNIMLVSVSQRTREIGIRKAIGASQSDILVQFLLEAAILSLLGAAIGVGVGMGLAFLVEAVSPLPATTPAWAVAVAVGLGVTVGLLSGIYPARRAARLDPITALGFE